MKCRRERELVSGGIGKKMKTTVEPRTTNYEGDREVEEGGREGGIKS